MCRWISSGSKSIAEVPSSGRPSRVIAPAVKSIASAVCVFPVPPCPTIAIVLSRPISSTAIVETPCKVAHARLQPNVTACPAKVRDACHTPLTSLPVLIVRPFQTYVTRNDSLANALDVKQKRTVGIDSLDDSSLPLRPVYHCYAHSGKRRVTLP